MLELLLAALLGQQPAAPPASPSLDYEFYKARVQPLFLEKREGHARCVTCHGGSTTLRLQRLPEGATGWTEEQTRQNFEAVSKMVVPGSPGASRLLRHPLSRAAGVVTSTSPSVSSPRRMRSASATARTSSFSAASRSTRASAPGFALAAGAAACAAASC